MYSVSPIHIVSSSWLNGYQTDTVFFARLIQTDLYRVFHASASTDQSKLSSVTYCAIQTLYSMRWNAIKRIYHSIFYIGPHIEPLVTYRLSASPLADMRPRALYAIRYKICRDISSKYTLPESAEHSSYCQILKGLPHFYISISKS